ncbi:REP element-mobilizing transposase RayT [Salibacterium salarium]|nr:REP element-mobilizing transposase RayT [Salibacterium salarium]
MACQPKTSTYHIMIRGARHSNLFYSRTDYSHFLHLLTTLKYHFSIDVHAYSFVPNQIHLLIETFQPKISTIICQIQTKYAAYFNQSYRLNGLIFQGQCISQRMKDDTHFYQTSRFIHLLPLMQKVTSNIYHYRWSSARDFLAPQAEDATMHPLLTINRTLEIFPHPRHESFHDFLYSSIQMKMNL